MALSIRSNGCCSCQSLTGVGVHAMICCLLDCMFHRQIHTLDFGTYRASLSLYKIRLSDTC